MSDQNKIVGIITDKNAAKKKLAFGLIFVLVLYLLLSFYGIWKVRSAYAVVEGEVISWQEYEQAKTAYKNQIIKQHQDLMEATGDTAEEAGDPFDSVDLEEYTRTELVLAHGLEEAAASKGISVAEKEINDALKADSQFLDNLKGEPSAEKTRQAYSEMEWDSRDVDRYYTTSLLRNKLEEELIEVRDVLALSTFYDAPAEGLLSNQKEGLARSTLKEVAVPWLEDESLTRPDIIARIDSYNKQDSVKKLGPSKIEQIYLPNLNTDEFIGLIRDASLKEKPDEILSALNGARTRSKVMKSYDGYMVLYWQDGYSAGDYGSWEDFIEKKSEKAVFFNDSIINPGRLAYGFTYLFRGEGL